MTRENRRDDQARLIGRRVRYWRRRNLDRRTLADMVGRSVSWLDKIEKGERSLLRLPMLERVAAVLGIDPTDTHQTVFGPTNVAVHRVAALVRLHEVGAALAFAAGIAPTAIAALPPERKVNYLLDVTEAYARTGQYREAVRTLGEAERVAPEEVRCRPLTHGLVRSLLASTSGEPGRMVRQVALRAGVTA